MIFAPILITTLSRDVHFIRLIESLKRNTWAQYTDVFIGLDYPPSEKYREGYNTICQYLENNFDDFRSFNVIKRTKNYGSLKNMTDLREMVLKTHDRFIRTDDDAEFSPNFLEYMNKCLMNYKDDPNVVAVTGYSYPINWSVSKNANVLKENFSCPMWGTGFWREKYKVIYDSIVIKKCLLTNINSIITSGAMERMLDVAKNEFVNLCLSPDFENTLAAKVSDISVRIYTATYDKYVIVPTLSKVRNWGFDGTGEYCCKTTVKKTRKISARNYAYHLQPIDTSNEFVLKEDTLNAVLLNKNRMNEFDGLALISKIRIWSKLMLYKILGRTRFYRFTYIFRKIK